MSRGVRGRVHETATHENNYPRGRRHRARSRWLTRREARRQQAFAAAVAFWDPGAA